MKRIYTIIVAILITVSVFAQSPEKMSYQAVVRDASNNLITNQTVGMQISILQGSATGTEVYVETQSPVTNANGLISIEIGTGTTNDDLSAIDWANGIYFIKTEIDPAGGTDYTITGTSQLLSVPYALYAKTAGDITETDLADILTNGNDGGAKQIKNIADPTDAQDAATKAYIDKKFQQLNIANSGVTDYDGNHYNALLIGNQIWMAENLRVTHYADGSEIDPSNPAPAEYTVAEWAALGVYDRAYCFYNNDTNSEYGALYTYYAATAGDNSGTGVQGICPDGWHLPSDAEWATLINELGGTSVAGGELKETGTTHWAEPNTGATNNSGFSALPGGYRGGSSGAFDLIEKYGYWWSATKTDATHVWNSHYLSHISAEVYSNSDSKSDGFSVRCVRD